MVDKYRDRLAAVAGPAEIKRNALRGAPIIPGHAYRLLQHRSGARRGGGGEGQRGAVPETSSRRSLETKVDEDIYIEQRKSLRVVAAGTLNKRLFIMVQPLLKYGNTMEPSHSLPRPYDRGFASVQIRPLLALSEDRGWMEKRRVAVVVDDNGIFVFSASNEAHQHVIPRR